MSEENKHVVRRIFREVWSEGDLGVVDELFARDWVGHTPLREFRERTALKQFVAARRQAYPDLRITVEAQIAERDLVATRWTARSTPLGDGEARKAETSSGMTLARLACGKIVEEWTSWGAWDLLQQTGVVAGHESSGPEPAPETYLYKESGR